jgi:peptidoglycan/LPS O-acetylase OafA/YrhL
MNTKVSTRNNSLDWLRVLGILFVFIYHSTRLYNVETFIVKNEIWYPSVELWNMFATSFMMPLMFAISGASLFYAMGRGGFGKFLKDKTLRLLIPLLVADLTHISVQAYLENHTHGLFSGNYFQFLPQYYHLDAIPWDGMHLWYLLYLFVFSIALYPLMRWLKGGGRDFLSGLDGWLSKTGVVYLLALPILLLLMLPSEFPLMEINGGWPYLTYLFFILWGFLIVSDERLQESIRKLRWISLSTGLLLAAGFSIVYSQIAEPEIMSPILILVGAMRTFGGWLCVLAFFGLGKQYLNMRTHRLDYANEAVLPFYILHQTVLVVVGYFVLQWALPDAFEWAIIVVVSFVIIMVVYEYLVRRWNVMRFLFGMKLLPRRQAVPAGQVQDVAPSTK